jgi:hypothetical protein
MKTLTRTKALAKLAETKARFRKLIREDYEHKAKDCSVCEQQGICCRDEHFVNVHITRLEAEAIRGRLERLSAESRRSVAERTLAVIEKYGLKDSRDSFSRTYSCPLFESGTGCLVHGDTKPLPCIHHACYESKEDVPPRDELEEYERKVERLNARSLGNAWNWQPIPVWLEDLDLS